MADKDKGKKKKHTTGSAAKADDKTKGKVKGKVTKDKPAKAKSEKKLEIPVVLRPDSLVDVMHHDIQADKEAREDVKELPKVALKYLVDRTFSTIFGHVAAGGKFQIMKWVTVGPSCRLGRMGRNPQTGADVKIDDKLGVRWTSGKELKGLIDGNKTLKAKLVAEAKERKAAREKKAAEKAKAEKSGGKKIEGKKLKKTA